MKTLAETLGETSHLSPLIRKFRRMGVESPGQMRQLAVQRGCMHYRNDAPEIRDPGTASLSNEELVVALLLGENTYDPDLIRIAGQLLSLVENEDLLHRLAVCERVEGRLGYIAEKGMEVEPDNQEWVRMSKRYPRPAYPSGVLPHADRFTTDVPRKKLTSPRERQWLRIHK